MINYINYVKLYHLCARTENNQICSLFPMHVHGQYHCAYNKSEVSMYQNSGLARAVVMCSKSSHGTSHQYATAEVRLGNRGN